jgi:hypothetical protein
MATLQEKLDAVAKELELELAKVLDELGLND